MDSGSLSAAGYILFVIPGFIAVWTFRHFTGSKDKLGEFEYVMWSSIWGFILLFSIIVSGLYIEHKDIPIPLNSSMSFLTSAIGMSLILTSIAAPLAGYIVAALSKTGVFAWLDAISIRLLDRVVRLFKWH